MNKRSLNYDPLLDSITAQDVADSDFRMPGESSLNVTIPPDPFLVVTGTWDEPF